jgi:HEAT repeat protein
VRDVAAWLTHLARTLKTCRLYDPNNPTVVRFREDLAGGLRVLLERHGAVRLDVAARELLYEGAVVFTARSRDDNLPGIFHRDGIRAMTFLPGIETRELEALVDLILHVTGPTSHDDDLVTSLWEANLPNLVVVSVPLEGDADGGGQDEIDEVPAMPWPGPPADPVGTAREPEATSAPMASRSDDWEHLADSGDLEESFGEIEASGTREIARFQQEHEIEIRASVVAGMVGVLTDGLAADSTAQDREEIGRFLPRVLREAIALGDWPTASAALRPLRECDPGWSAAAFFEGHATASSLMTRKAVQALDQQDDRGIEAFLALARELGEGATEWLVTVLTESQQKRARRPLTRAIADLVRDNPERVLPWMTDERWYVVRNIVHILGWIGGDAIAGYLKVASEHPEPRVRREAVAALSDASPAVARPMLLAMLEGAETRLFALVVQQLSQSPDAMVAKRLIELLQQPRFLERPEEERRAVYLGLASQGDHGLEALEQELHRGNLFSRGLDPHWQSVARCIARIGTERARAALDRGLKSPKAGVRKACELARAALGESHD